nr:hypothetical protein GCM10017610_26670 [Curtobacterium pusillum]
MAKIVIAPDGVKLAKAPGMGNKAPPKRGKASGWTKAVARRNNDFLMSVDGEELATDPGSPFALSLTFGRAEVVTPAALRDSREALFDRFRRMGVTRLHWLVEFQGDGVPHLHMILYLPRDAALSGVEASLRRHWLEVAGWSGAHLKGQHVVPVSHLRGWKQYLGKHGIRGVHHYQRQMPDGWEEPGRMWGKLGTWPTRSIELECDLATFFRFRRILRSYRVAEARALLAKAPPDKLANLRRSLGFARRCLREPNPEGSPKATLRGMNLWVPEYTTLRVATFLSNQPSALVRPWQHRAETVPALTK